MKNLAACILSFLSLVFVENARAQNWELAWEKQAGGQDMDEFTDVIEDRAGGFTVLGSTRVPGRDNHDFWLVRFNEQGDIIWAKTYGTPGDEYPSKLAQSPDGSYPGNP